LHLKPKNSPVPVKRKKGLAKIIGRTELPIQVDTPKPKPRPRPKKTSRPKKSVAGGQQPDATTPGSDDADKKSKAKKGKRFVRFSHEPQQPGAARGKKGKRKGQVVVDAEDIGRFSGRLAGGVRFGRGHRGGPKKKKRDNDDLQVASETKAIKKRIKVYETISVGDLAHRMGAKSNEIISKLIALGVMATVNQALDVDTAILIASDFGFEVEQGVTDEQSILNLDESERGGEKLTRPPVITVMGHVDHGKTSILDAIRDTDVAAGEAGGITQHIGAHYVRSPQGDLVFLDTPGHAAFTEMRSRGAQVTDVVVLVVAADDGVMDQTKEAINHARAAEVPILVAVNKIDKNDAEPARVQRELAELDLVPEEWGGDTIFCETSAKNGIGIENLVENILLQTEILELKADPDRRAKGWVIEAQLHKGRGAVATVLVQHGTLRVGDYFVAGLFQGKVRSLTDDKGRQIKEAGPSTPVEVQGLSGVPKAGDEFVVVPDEKMARSVSSDRQLKSRESVLATGTKISLDNLFDKLQEGDIKELRVLLRADVQGTLEAFGKAIEKLSTDAIKVKVLHEGTGTIVESDVSLAAASDALIIGFNVRPSVKVTEMAKSESVDLRFYDVIYHALDDIRKAMTGLLDPTFEESVIGSVDIREIFTVPKIGTIAGCYVTNGKVERSAKVRLLRDGIVVYTGNISSLRRFKDDAKEVNSGYECGIGIENYNDIKVGDQLEVFIMEETEAEL
jgi:translation initiation factor IF-2